MTISEAIGQVDLLKPNPFTEDEKKGWLLRLEKKIEKEIVDTHEGGGDIEDVGEKLRVGMPYDDIYLFWLEAQIDYHNGEIEKYNNSITVFNYAYNAFQLFYNRTHLPKKVSRKYF